MRDAQPFWRTPTFARFSIMEMTMNSRLTQQAIRQATRVGSNLKQSAEAFVEQEVGPLRERVGQLERRVAELERLLADQRTGNAGDRR